LDVVIPVHGKLDLLESALRHLDSARGNHEVKVWIVDDKSPTPVKVKELKRLGLGFELRVSRNAHNDGFGMSANKGASQGTAPLILHLNSDVDLQPGAIGMMIEDFVDDEVGVVGARLIFPPDSCDKRRPAGKIQHAGIVVGFDGNPFHVHIGWPADHPRANIHQEMQMVTGACMMTRRDLWRLLGGFSEVYGRGTFEDIEYCVGVRMKGFKVMYQPEALGHHCVGASILAAKSAYPIGQNSMIWKVRCGKWVFWDEWRFW
jgi:GT2 family glycosyltransferase